MKESMRKLKVTEMNRISTDEFKQSRKMPLVVVLDHVRSLYNVGSVFRTGDAFRIEKIMLCGITATPPHPEIHKTALGAEDSVEWEYFSDTPDAVAALKAQGYKVFSVEQVEHSTSLETIKLDAGEKYAVIMGNEVKGVQQCVVDSSDACLEIPQFGRRINLPVDVGFVKRRTILLRNPERQNFLRNPHAVQALCERKFRTAIQT